MSIRTEGYIQNIMAVVVCGTVIVGFISRKCIKHKMN